MKIKRLRLPAQPFLIHRLSSETIAAVHRAVVARLERNLAGLSALCTYGIKHLACAVSAWIVVLTLDTTGLAALRFVCKILFSIKLLLTGRKSEFLSAIPAD